MRVQACVDRGDAGGAAQAQRRLSAWAKKRKVGQEETLGGKDKGTYSLLTVMRREEKKDASLEKKNDSFMWSVIVGLFFIFPFGFLRSINNPFLGG